MATKKKAVEADTISTTSTSSTPTSNDSSGTLAIASIVVGVLSLCSSIFWCCGLPFGITSVVLGVLGRKSEDKSNLATIGIILGAVGIVLSICFVIFSMVNGGINYDYEYYL